MTGPARETGKTTVSGSRPRALRVKKLPATLPTAASRAVGESAPGAGPPAPLMSRKSQRATAPAGEGQEKERTTG